MSASASGAVTGQDLLTGLPLTEPTPAGWVDVALADVGRLLADHAHCEQKAASTALSTVARFPQHRQLVEPLLALAHEEIRHFRQVLGFMERRGVEFTRPEPDRYVRELRDLCCADSPGLGAPTDLLIVAAFVEARSCERFRLLANALPGADHEFADLGTFYRRLAQAECRHWELFRGLACTLQPEERVHARLEELAVQEGALIRRLPLAPRMH